MGYVTENRDWLEPYVLQVRDLMGLGHWNIRVLDDPPMDECDASTSISTNYLQARMMFGPPDVSAGQDAGEEFRALVAHELLHLHLHDLEQTTRMLEEHINPPTWHLVEQVQHRALERTVDAMARAWAETLPLPPITKEADDA